MLVPDRPKTVHGFERRPVGRVGAALPADAAERWQGATLARYARRSQRGVVDLAHRSRLARPAESVSSLSNLSPALSAVAPRRHAHPLADRAGRRPARSREDRSERNVHRRQFQFGEKRGAAVGPTRRGKGSKIMAIADRHGLPVAICVASASPHETQLVEATLTQRFVKALPERMIGDRAYDSDRLDHQLRQLYGIELIPRTARGAPKPSLKMAARCAGTRVAGKSNASSPGCTTFAAWSPVGNITWPTSWPCSIWPALSSC